MCVDKLCVDVKYVSRGADGKAGSELGSGGGLIVGISWRLRGGAAVGPSGELIRG